MIRSACRLLASKSLQGELSPSLANIPTLESILLGNNVLAGAIPDEWNSNNALPALRTLSLLTNRLNNYPSNFGNGGASTSMPVCGPQHAEVWCGAQFIYSSTIPLSLSGLQGARPSRHCSWRTMLLRGASSRAGLSRKWTSSACRATSLLGPSLTAGPPTFHPSLSSSSCPRQAAPQSAAPSLRASLSMSRPVAQLCWSTVWSRAQATHRHHRRHCRHRRQGGPYRHRPRGPPLGG
jgi:hypothetical protein